MRQFCIVLLAIVSTAVYAAGENTDGFTATEIKAGLHMLQGRGGNLLVSSGDDGLLLIDDDYQDLSAALKKQLDALGGWQKLQYVINTHWHGDHTGGNEALGEVATILAHENVRVRLSTHQEVAFFKMVSEPKPEVALPSITYDQQLTLYFNGENIRVQHFPNGHTDGDSVIFFEQANLVHMGDHYFNGFFPFVDLASGGNVVQLSKNVEQVYAQLDEKSVVVPGHGALSNKQQLADYIAMLQGSISEVQAMKNQGLSLPAIQEQGLSSRWNSWKNGFINEANWITFVYRSL